MPAAPRAARPPAGSALQSIDPQVTTLPPTTTPAPTTTTTTTPTTTPEPTEEPTETSFPETPIFDEMVQEREERERTNEGTDETN
jgi:hypothetical protein